jgi:hypothetical protein
MCNRNITVFGLILVLSFWALLGCHIASYWLREVKALLKHSILLSCTEVKLVEIIPVK